MSVSGVLTLKSFASARLEKTWREGVVAPRPDAQIRSTKLIFIENCVYKGRTSRIKSDVVVVVTNDLGEVGATATDEKNARGAGAAL